MAINKHSKYKNTGLLFELLVRQITADTMNNTNSPAINTLKKYFVNTELGKEYKLYEQLDRVEIKTQRYNLIKEIKKNYDVERFFKAKVTNYKIYAALNNLIENQNNRSITPADTINNKITLLEHLIKVPTAVKGDTLMEEYMKYPKDVKILTHRLMLEKFNEKYDHFLPEQKIILKEIVTSIDNTSKLRDFYNIKITEVQSIIANKIKSVEDEVIKIKLQEVTKYVTTIEKSRRVTNENIVNLLQYYELIHNL